VVFEVSAEWTILSVLWLHSDATPAIASEMEQSEPPLGGDEDL
jgi:hypothetical protein